MVDDLELKCLGSQLARAMAQFKLALKHVRNFNICMAFSFLMGCSLQNRQEIRIKARDWERKSGRTVGVDKKRGNGRGKERLKN